MGRSVLSDEAYTKVAEKVTEAGSATHAGEQRHREGLGLHPLVDPKGYGLIRRSLSWYEPEGDHFILLRGVAMLEETRLDTTGSMGGNVEIAMKVLPKTYNLLATGSQAVLARYDTQMITSIFGDICDNYVLCRSQAEMDERIAEQMTYMLPERNGGDYPEDPQYGLFGGAYLTHSAVVNYGLKYYDFTVSDAPGRNALDSATLIRVFGETVFEKVAENGHDIDRKNLPTTREVVLDLQKRAHAFFLMVRDNDCSGARSFWDRIYGKDYVIEITDTNSLPFIKAAVIGLTEGVIDLQTLPDFLSESGLDKKEACDIRDSMAHIPLNAQAILPNFGKIPLRGAKFANKGDLWPIQENLPKAPAHNLKKDKSMWS